MSSSAIAQMLEQGARPAGPYATQLADALLCAAAVHRPHRGRETVDLLRLLLPGRFRALYGSATIVHFHEIVVRLDHPNPTLRASARDVAVRLASDEVSLNPVAAPAANYEGKHRNGS